MDVAGYDLSYFSTDDDSGPLTWDVGTISISTCRVMMLKVIKDINKK